MCFCVMFGTESISQAKVDAAAKWMEAVRGMEALAAFSRTKLKNFERLKQKKVKESDSDDENMDKKVKLRLEQAL